MANLDRYPYLSEFIDFLEQEYSFDDTEVFALTDEELKSYYYCFIKNKLADQ